MKDLKMTTLQLACKNQMRRLVFSIGLVLSLTLFVFSACLDEPKIEPVQEVLLDEVYTYNYDAQLLNASPKNELIQFGFEVFQNTSKYIGPENTEEANMYAGNNLSCNNCHLASGTKPFAAPLIGISKRFPQYRGRENKIGSLEERVNGCMERSMNGKALPVNSKAMQGLLAYMEWLSRYSPADGKIAGQGFVSLIIPDRAIDYDKGQLIFNSKCSVCHGIGGKGVKSPEGTGYEYPPLWGNDSYNNGAGMTRVITAARFIKGNMPFGTTYNNPVLSDEEAYDVAGFINQQQRPIKKNREKDFPDLRKKPVSTPYPPYADTFSIQQHQVGPFPPIIKYYQNEYNIVKSK